MHISGSPGKIVFDDGGTTTNPGHLIIAASMPGAGVIETSATTAGGKITVSGSYTFTISGDVNVADGDLTVDGLMLVSGSGDVTVTGGDLTFEDAFENDGDFIISGSNTVTAEFQGAVAAGSSGDWDINNANCTVHLVTTDSAVTNTLGDIQFRGGTIDADASFQFAGTMKWSDNDTTIAVASSKVFHATSD